MSYIDFLHWQSRAIPYQTTEAFIISVEPLDEEEGHGQNAMAAIWQLAHANSMAKLIALTGLGPSDFSRAYGFPVRTVQDWKAGIRTPPESVRNLLGYAIFSTLSERNFQKTP